jgi:hypothetical protein
MATKEQVKAKTIELIQELPHWLPQKVDKILNSGCVDVGYYPDNYSLPKLIMRVLAQEIEEGFKPNYPIRANDKEVKNMRRFA